MKRWIGPVVVAIAAVVAIPAFLGASMPPNYATQMIGQPLDVVMHETRQMAFFSSETCWRELTPDKGVLTKRHCDDLSRAATTYETARLQILRAQHKGSK